MLQLTLGIIRAIVGVVHFLSDQVSGTVLDKIKVASYIEKQTNKTNKN